MCFNKINGENGASKYPYSERGIAPKACGRRERDRDRHPRKDEREQAHHAEDADEADAHDFPFPRRAMMSATTADPTIPVSTGIQ